MKRLAKALVVLLGLAVIGSVASLVPQKSATATGSAPVTVMNTTPIPVAGSVTATVSGTVAAQQSGSWNVGITGTPNINVGNFPTVQPVSFSNSSSTPLFVDTDSPARSAASGQCNASYSQIGIADCILVTVPAGKILVVDTLSASANVPSGQSVSELELLTQARDVSGAAVELSYIVPVRLIGSNSNTFFGKADFYAFGGPLTFYAIGGSTIEARSFTIDTSGFGNLYISFSGHLVTP